MTTTRAKAKPQLLGPKALAGSSLAKRQAAVILEVLSGLRGPVDGSQAMSVSLTRYYALETRALQGLIEALEARPMGRRQSPENEVRRLERDKRKLERELDRAQALLRAAQRSIGIPPPASLDKKGPSGRKRRRPTVRAKRAIEALTAPGSTPILGPAPEAGPEPAGLAAAESRGC